MHKSFIFLTTFTFCKHNFRLYVYKEYNLWLAYIYKFKQFTIVYLGSNRNYGALR